jgi:NAD(P)-dependent dehydrogenase (short-subunit alcohol dehydrogenase family)
MVEKRTVLITGVSSGIGQATARLLAQRNFSIFGTARNPSGVESIPGVEVLPLDVRSQESVNTCLDTVLKRAGRLDILVNNAGHGMWGAIEEVALEEAKALFETNFFHPGVRSENRDYNSRLRFRLFGSRCQIIVRMRDRLVVLILTVARPPTTDPYRR